MPLYCSKEPLNTDKQFIFTCNSDMQSDGFWIALCLNDEKLDIDNDLNELANTMQAFISIDASNGLLPSEEYTVDSIEKTITKEETIQEDKSFTFLDKECIWLGPVKLQSANGKFYEKIDCFNGERDTYTDENNIIYAAAPEGKYHIDDNKCVLNNDIYKVVTLVSYENGQRQKNINYNTNFNFNKNKIKLTITKNGIVSLYIDSNKLSDFKFNYVDKNNMFLYIGSSNQNILSNAAVSAVESSDTSANIA